MAITQSVPVLNHGDRLTRDEFERRYDAMPNTVRAELIDGVVYMPSPVRYDQHGQQHLDLASWMGVYRAYTPGIGAGDNSTVRLNLDSEPQPDGVMFIEHGGATFLEDGYITGAPEWAAEVSASTAEFDLGPKLQLYRRNGVREYVVWRVLDSEIDWFILRGQEYERLPANTAGIYCSTVLPGLWLDQAAMLRGDLPRVHEVLHMGLKTPEHQALVEELARRKGVV